MVRLLTTRRTPSVCLATTPALARPADVSTVPLSVTIWSFVSTLMSLFFSVSSLTKRALTREVIHPSVMISPVLLTPSLVLFPTTFAPLTTPSLVFVAPFLMFSPTPCGAVALRADSATGAIASTARIATTFTVVFIIYSPDSCGWKLVLQDDVHHRAVDLEATVLQGLSLEESALAEAVHQAIDR